MCEVGKEGQHRTPYTLFFKLQVAKEFLALQQKKELGIVPDPLQRTSELFQGLSKSNIWNWAQQHDNLMKQLTHMSIVGFKCKRIGAGSWCPSVVHVLAE